MRDRRRPHNPEDDLDNEVLTVKEKDPVELVVLRATDIGYVVMVNQKHIGLLHYNEIFVELEDGEKLTGYVKAIKAGNKLDIVPGKAGYARMGDEADKILALLKKHKGVLPFHDKSEPEAIYDFFGMSKKTFKAAIGNLYKQKKIEIGKDEIKLVY